MAAMYDHEIVPARGPYPEIHRGVVVTFGAWASKLAFVPKTEYTLGLDWGKAKAYSAYESFEDLVMTIEGNRGYSNPLVRMGHPSFAFFSQAYGEAR